MVFGKILKKHLGKTIGGVADQIVDGALDKATGGISSTVEGAVKEIKAKKRARKAK